MPQSLATGAYSLVKVVKHTRSNYTGIYRGCQRGGLHTITYINKPYTI